MSTSRIIRKLKAEGILGDFVRVRRDGTLLLRARTPKEGYRNGNMLQAIMLAYVREKGIDVR
jgi:hypothetical protein